MEMFRRDSFLIASNWEQSKHPLTDEKINNLWHFHTVVYLLGNRKEQSTGPCMDKSHPAVMGTMI